MPASDYPFNRDEWLNIFGNCQDCAEGRCSRLHEFGYEDVQRATGWSVFKQAMFFGVHPSELAAKGRPDSKEGKRTRFRDRFEALKRGYEPRDQFTTFGGSKKTHYGVTKRLEEAGYRMPSEFSGNSNQLAEKIGIDHADLARTWTGSEQELRQLGLIKITHPPKK
ncbi:hypothetical protein M3672_14900 [Microbacterium enclense]|uniref:hypothetical protein n=1 Tax=Microbacterium enclense TaxID=993073 RepID=UPI00203D5D25|nr:hypothetical protein [Microbacterium enclense]MCM3615718.1 hypothetical protein [Microbacterium enclense]